MSDRSVLITGAAGFIGSALGRAMPQPRVARTPLDSFSDYYPESLKRRNLAAIAGEPNCQFGEADLLDGDLDLTRMLAKVTMVFHLAAQPGVRASWEDFATYTALNVNATQRLLHAARLAPLERFVLAAAPRVYGDAETLGDLIGRRVERRYCYRQVGAARDTAADIGRGQRDLGYAPSFSVEAGVKAQLDWQRAIAAPPRPRQARS